MWRKNIKTSTDYVIINIQKSIDTKQNRLYDRDLNIKWWVYVSKEKEIQRSNVICLDDFG